MSLILVLDDEANNVTAISRLLHPEPNLDVEGFTSAAEALKRAEEVSFDVAVVDYRMPEMDGTQFLKKFREIQPDAYRIIVSAYSDVSMLKKAINQAQIHSLIQKPWEGFLLFETILRGTEHAQTARNIEQLHQQITEQQDCIGRLSELLQQISTKHPDAVPTNWKELLPPSK